MERGLLTRDQLRGSAWRQVLYGVYADADLALNHPLMCRAARLVIPPQAAIAGRSAAALYGADLLGADDPVEVLVSCDIPRFGPASGLVIRRTTLPAEHVHQHRGLTCTTPERTCWDIARGVFGQDLVESVVHLDAMLRINAVDSATAYKVFDTRPRAKGWARARKAYMLADGRAESPQESRVRVQLVLAGIPAPVPQYEITMGGRLIARVDLAWPQHRVAVEYDGHWHADPAQLRKDRRRLNALITAGWTVLHVTDDRLRHDLGGIVTEVRKALSL